MTGLLISVRSAAEALAAIEGGADVIDVKEPRNGSLGRASAKVLREVASAVDNRVPLSAALGELYDPHDDAAIQALQSYDYAKIGLAGAGRITSWRTDWSSVVRQLPASVRPVAVIYADGIQHHAPAVDEILSQAIELTCAGVLIDTFRKDGQGLFDHWSTDTVARILDFVREQKLLSVLAGALNHQSIQQAVSLAPDYIALRSAVCQGSRDSLIRAELVASMSSQLACAGP